MCLISTVTVLSGATRMKAFGAKLPSAVAAVAAAAIRLPPAKAKPMTRPAPAAAEALRNCRRLAGRARTASDAGAVLLMRFARMGTGLPEERKSVGLGKSGSVRVDLGGRGILTKK